ncbi:hypothetical protein XAP6164_5960001 [Xanthomonas phaseoli pv. phaseoli]|nr:hypothetical protein XAP6164_5960001 [Xanthomonas phaseoli pv. phaseoli]
MNSWVCVIDHNSLSMPSQKQIKVQPQPHPRKARHSILLPSHFHASALRAKAPFCLCHLGNAEGYKSFRPYPRSCHNFALFQ